MSGRKNTDEDVRARLAAVEAVLMSGEYSRSAQSALASRFAVSVRQIQRDAAAIRGEWASEVVASDKATDKADWLARVRKAQSRSFKAGHSMAAARLLQLEGQALGVYEAEKVEVSHQVHTIEDAPRLAAELLKSLPAACNVLGVDVPQLPIIDVESE